MDSLGSKMFHYATFSYQWHDVMIPMGISNVSVISPWERSAICNELTE